MPPLSPPWEPTGSYTARLEALRAAVQARDHRALAGAYRSLEASGETDRALRALGTLFSSVLLRKLLTWTDRWLRDPQNDALRARGDLGWQAMNWLDYGLRWHLSLPSPPTPVLRVLRVTPRASDVKVEMQGPADLLESPAALALARRAAAEFLGRPVDIDRQLWLDSDLGPVATLYVGDLLTRRHTGPEPER